MNHCGKCNLEWHQPRDSGTGCSGQIWIEGLGFHPYEPPNKDQIRERLRKRYGII